MKEWICMNEQGMPCSAEKERRDVKPDVKSEVKGYLS